MVGTAELKKICRPAKFQIDSSLPGLPLYPSLPFEIFIRNLASLLMRGYNCDGSDGTPYDGELILCMNYVTQ